MLKFCILCCPTPGIRSPLMSINMVFMGSSELIFRGRGMLHWCTVVCCSSGLHLPLPRGGSLWALSGFPVWLRSLKAPCATLGDQHKMAGIWSPVSEQRDQAPALQSALRDKQESLLGVPDAADSCGGCPDQSAWRRERVALLLFVPGSLHWGLSPGGAPTPSVSPRARRRVPTSLSLAEFPGGEWSAD